MLGGVVPKKPDAFAVFPYSVDKLEEIIAGVLRSTVDVVSAKLHREYFKDYFSALNAKTVVVEYDYIDRDFLEDFAAYYVRCFGDYERKCARLHFFKIDFTTQLFTNCLSGAASAISETTLQENYLGFIVIRPLPQTFIGRTCLSTYDTTSTGRYFPATFEYGANLFGIRLTRLYKKHADHLATVELTGQCEGHKGNRRYRIHHGALQDDRYESEVSPRRSFRTTAARHLRARLESPARSRSGSVRVG